MKTARGCSIDTITLLATLRGVLLYQKTTTFGEFPTEVEGTIIEDGHHIIDTRFEQECIPRNEFYHKSYYPVLPKYDRFGNFIDGDFPDNNIPMSDIVPSGSV